MSILGFVYACPTCPSTYAFGLSRPTLWVLALAVSLPLLFTGKLAAEQKNDLGADLVQRSATKKHTKPTKEVNK